MDVLASCKYSKVFYQIKNIPEWVWVKVSSFCTIPHFLTEYNKYERWCHLAVSTVQCVWGSFCGWNYCCSRWLHSKLQEHHVQLDLIWFFWLQPKGLKLSCGWILYSFTLLVYKTLVYKTLVFLKTHNFLWFFFKSITLLLWTKVTH